MYLVMRVSCLFGWGVGRPILLVEVRLSLFCFGSGACVASSHFLHLARFYAGSGRSATTEIFLVAAF